MPLGTKVVLGRARPHCVRWGTSSPKGGGGHSLASPNFRPISIMAKRLPISVTAEHLFKPVFFSSDIDMWKILAASIS